VQIGKEAGGDNIDTEDGDGLDGVRKYWKDREGTLNIVGTVETISDS
jgi:hypothetical protein